MFEISNRSLRSSDRTWFSQVNSQRRLGVSGKQREPSSPTGLVRESAELRHLTSGATWSEGPVWLAARGSLRWSDIPGNRILEYNLASGTSSVYATDVEFTNGRTLDHSGTVIQCSHGRRAIEQDIDGRVTTLVDSWNGHRLNSPNDVIVANDGAIWFTDPPYGIVQAHEGHLGVREYGANFVFRFDPSDGVIEPVATDLEEPNGLAFSPGEEVFYVSDTSVALSSDGTGNHHIRAYDVGPDYSLSNSRVFVVIEPGVSDGLRVDHLGNIWTSSADAVQVFSPGGVLIGRIPVPEVVGNICFGGEQGTTLFIAATTSIYSIETTVTDATRARVKR
jgi:gluconolactonase